MGIYNYFYRYSFDLADCHSLGWVWPELKLWMAHISIPSCCLPNVISAKLDQAVWEFQVASKDISLIVTQLNSEQRLWPRLFKCGPYLLSSRLEIGRDVIKKVTKAGTSFNTKDSHCTCSVMLACLDKLLTNSKLNLQASEHSTCFFLSACRDGVSKTNQAIKIRMTPQYFYIIPTSCAILPSMPCVC